MSDKWRDACQYAATNRATVDWLLVVLNEFGELLKALTLLQAIPSDALVLTHPFHSCAQALIANHLLPDRHIVIHPGAFIFESHMVNSGGYLVPSYVH